MSLTYEGFVGFLTPPVAAVDFIMPIISTASSAYIFLAAFFCLCVDYVFRRVPLPPGPFGWPIVGNLFNMPHEYEWLHWETYKDAYGELGCPHFMFLVMVYCVF
jgi:hypothetical protein